MFQSIEKLRRKPDNLKRSIALWVTIVLFALVVFVWLSSVNIVNIKKEEKELGQKAPSPISAIKESVSSIFRNADEEVDSIKIQLQDSGAQDGERL